MTDSLPQILLLFDTSVILNGSTRLWESYRQLGTCWLPQVVLDETRFLCHRAPEPNQEKIAREFFRFYPDSDWQATDEAMAHSALKPATGQTLSKRARQVLAIAECAYGVSQHFPEQLVVLVSDYQPLLKRIQSLQVLNLCGLTSLALKQWSLSGNRPEAINQACLSLKTAGIRQRTADVKQKTVRAPTPPKPTMRTSPTAKQSVTARPKTRKPSSSPSRRATPNINTASRFYALSQGVSLVISLAGFVIVGFLVWRLAQPQKFEQFWRRYNLPQFSGLASDRECLESDWFGGASPNRDHLQSQDSVTSRSDTSACMRAISGSRWMA